MKKYLILFFIYFGVYFECKSQLLKGEIPLNFYSIEMKSENLKIPEFGFLHLDTSSFNWQVKFGFGTYSYNSSNFISIKGKTSISNNIASMESGSAFFIKPGRVFQLSNKSAKRSQFLLALNLHFGVSKDKFEFVDYVDPVYGPLNNEMVKWTSNFAIESEWFHVFEVHNSIGIRSGVRLGLKIKNPEPFDEYFANTDNVRKGYTPGLGYFTPLYLNYSLGIILK